MNIAQLLDDATVQIAAALGLDRREARLESRVLASHAWAVDAAWLIAHDTDKMLNAQTAAFQTLLSRRLAGHPIAYIVGYREFYGRSFRVTPDVLIPRPDTELLVELALQRIPPDQPLEVLDLGTGSGCIAISLALERPLAHITAADCSEAAVAVARHNADRLGARITFLQSDWLTALDEQRFDLIVSNPPYIARQDPHLGRGDVRFEPITALTAGQDGLDDIRQLIAQSRAHLNPGGWLLLEHGYDQAESVRTLLNQHARPAPQSWSDLAGHARVSGAQVSE